MVYYMLEIFRPDEPANLNALGKDRYKEIRN